MADYQIISTKCPVINNECRGARTSPVLEVLVRFEGTEPVDVICPEYTTEKACIKTKGNCIYRTGWQTLE